MKTKVLIIGATGLIGNTLFKWLLKSNEILVFGTLRNNKDKIFFPKSSHDSLFGNIDLLHFESITHLVENIHPSIIINCVGITKHKEESFSISSIIELNSLLPHKLADLCSLKSIKLIHISSDCVFSGKKGKYLESEVPDASDLYGRSKALGEVINENHLTLRTSTIGHELNSSYGLLDWFLSKKNECVGFKKAIFSGLPTIFLAELIEKYVIPNQKLTGLYNVSASPINKYELLKIIAKVYNKEIKIHIDEAFEIDRSLDSTKFNLATGFEPPSWDYLIDSMHKNR